MIELSFISACDPLNRFFFNILIETIISLDQIDFQIFSIGVLFK
jgi:hypothetical protein